MVGFVDLHILRMTGNRQLQATIPGSLADSQLLVILSASNARSVFLQANVQA